MAVTVLNLSGNKHNFEDDMCKLLCDQITPPVEIFQVRGQDLVKNQPPMNASFRVMVIFGHAGSVGNAGTYIDTGLGQDGAPWTVEEQLNSPIVLLQTLKSSSVENVIFYSACCAVSPMTIVSGVRDPNCRGIVASTEEVKGSHCPLMGAIINGIHEKLEQGNVSDETLDSLVTHLAKKHGAYPSFRYYPSLRVIEEQE